MTTIVKKHNVQLDGEPAAALPRAQSSSRRCEKKVRWIAVEGTVRALELSCSCGEVTVVELEYPSPKE